MKRILFVLPRLGIGGVEQSLLNLLSSTPTQGVQVSVMVFTPGGELEGSLPEGVELKTAPSAGAVERLRSAVSGWLQRLGLKRLLSSAKSLYHHFGALLSAAPHQQDDTYDIAIAYADGAATWFVAQNIQAVKKYAFVHTDFVQAQYSSAQEGKIYHCFDWVYVSSKAAREHFLQLLPQMAEKTSVMYSAINLQKIDALARCQDSLPPRPETGLTLLTVGRLSWEKGVEKIPELLYRLKKDGVAATWYLAGEGPERTSLVQQARRLGVSDSLILLGNLLNPYPLLAACDIYIQPSQYEGYCLALAEARALHRPIVACDFSGAREQLRDGVNGFVVGMSPDEMYEKIKQLALDADLRARFSAELKRVQVDDIPVQWWT